MNILKDKLSFLMSAVVILGFFLLFWIKDVNLASEIVTIVGMYVVGRAAQKGWMVSAAAKDPNADTEAVIREVEGKPQPAPKGQPPVDSPD
jgi:hypothetical protein